MDRLQQKDMSIEEYRQNMKLLLIRAGIRKKLRITIFRFHSGLNYEIWDKVKLLPYNDFNDLAQLCVRVEQQPIRKNIIRRDY